jgi:Helix-turn-helix domain
MHNLVLTPVSLEALAERVALKTLEKFKTHQNQFISEPSKQWLDLNELVKYDPEKRCKATFYGYRANGSIPFHKRGKKLIFLKSEIDHWLKNGRVKTVSEIEEETENQLSKRQTAS